MRRRHKIAAITFATALIIAECYALYASTFHLFKFSKPMCPVCVAMKNYDHSVVDALHIPTTSGFFEFLDVNFSDSPAFVHSHFYFSRAPPSI